jgi:hypothetical protein
MKRMAHRVGTTALPNQVAPNPSPHNLLGICSIAMPDTELQICENIIECVPTSACPCCNRSRGSFDDRLTLNEPQRLYKRSHQPEKEKLPSLISKSREDDDDDDDDNEFDNDLLPGTLSSGVNYSPTTVIAEGWVHKKGTGNDWLGSRSWKARYAKLVVSVSTCYVACSFSLTKCFFTNHPAHDITMDGQLARVDGYSVEVPLLLMYWFQQSDTPSTVIALDSTVVVPVDIDDTTEWNAFQFNVVYARQDSRDDRQCTRTFTAPQKGRNTWVLKINEALMTYEKAKSIEKKRQQQLLLLQNRPTSPGFSIDDKFLPINRSATFSPPSSPRPADRPKLPRPDRLMGEGFVR